MPATYTHYRFASDVLQQLPEPLQSRIAPNRAVLIWDFMVRMSFSTMRLC